MRTCSQATVRGLPNGHKSLRLLNLLTFGTEACPSCSGWLQYRDSSRDFSGTARIESEWSRMKRQVRKLYGRFQRRYLEGLLREWEARADFPELFASPQTHMRKCLFRLS